MDVPAEGEDGDQDGDGPGTEGGGPIDDKDGGGQGGGGEGGDSGGAGNSGGGAGGGISGPDHNRRVDLAKVRIYCSDPATGQYRLMFEPRVEDATHLRVFVIGEVGAEPAEIASYSVNGGPPVPNNGQGLIGPLPLKKGQRAVLDVILQDSLRCALGVNAYAN